MLGSVRTGKCICWMVMRRWTGKRLRRTDEGIESEETCIDGLEDALVLEIMMSALFIGRGVKALLDISRLAALLVPGEECPLGLKGTCLSFSAASLKIGVVGLFTGCCI